MNPNDENVYFSKPGVASVSWHEVDHTVVVEWEGWADSNEFNALLEAEIQALKEHAGSLLLADCRQQKVIKPADQERANREWLPRALAAGLKRFAVVLPESGLAEMNVRKALDTVPSTRLEVGYFPSVEEARKWLAT